MKQIRITESSMADALAQIELLEGLNPKNKGSLRLLTEEMFSLCRELLGEDTLIFELRHNETRYELCVKCKTQVDEGARREFLSLSSSGRNNANKGVPGMLGAVLEAFSLDGEPALCDAAWNYGIQSMTGDYSCLWTLSQYMNYAPGEAARAAWDGMEKSIIANFADEVTIGVRKGWVEMTVIKTF